jgi:23S rRNA pseudouridine1911/1915/1917 synthase
MLKTIKVAYQDEAILVVNKPAGLLVIPDLTEILNKEFFSSGAPNYYPCHRLDRETSGLVIYAKGKELQEKIMLQFKEHRVDKTYIAFVQGVIEKDNFNISYPIENKPSLTEVRTLERRKHFSIVQINPLTGRTNQIRIHFKLIGHPLVGDRKFAFAKDYALKFRRAALHAFRISFIHPVNGATVNLEAGLPEDMKKFLATHN